MMLTVINMQIFEYLHFERNYEVYVWAVEDIATGGDALATFFRPV